MHVLDTWTTDRPILFNGPAQAVSFRSASELRTIIRNSTIENSEHHLEYMARPYRGPTLTFVQNPNPHLYDDSGKETIAKYTLDYYLPMMLNSSYVDGLYTDSLVTGALFLTIARITSSIRRFRSRTPVRRRSRASGISLACGIPLGTFLAFAQAWKNPVRQRRTSGSGHVRLICRRDGLRRNACVYPRRKLLRTARRGKYETLLLFERLRQIDSEAVEFVSLHGISTQLQHEGRRAD